MSERVTMPALGESVTEGTVTRWLKQVGDRVEVDEPLLEVSTDKVDTEIPSPASGILEQVLAGEDDVVQVGADLAVIGDGSGVLGNAPASAPEAQPAPEPQAAPEPVAAAQAEAPAAPAQAPPAQAPAPTGEEVSGGHSVTMPALGESVSEGTVTRWLKQEGDEVATDEPLLEVSTDKVDTEIPSPASGTLTKILAAEDDVVQVGGVLAIIGGQVSSAPATAPEPEAQPQAAPEPEPAPAPPQAAAPAAAQQTAAPPPAPPVEAPAPSAPPAAPAEPVAPVASGGPDDSTTYVTPLVRKLAEDNGIDLATLTGTGVGGRIRKQDVLAAAEAKKAAAPPAAAPAAAEAPAPAPVAAAASTVPPVDTVKRGTTEKMSRLRSIIAQRMVESLQTSAQLTSVVEVDVSKIARLRDRAKADFAQREGVGLSYLPFFALAAVEALKAHPNINASVDDQQITYHAAEHLGIAVDTERGLLVPVIKDAGDLNIAGLARKIADLAERTRTNRIGPDELSGGTFTITNTGSRGALFDTPIINQPQVAILGTGAVVKRAVVVQDGQGGETIAIRPMVFLALSYDHRIVDGADAARFLSAMKARLEEGAFESSLGL